MLRSVTIAWLHGSPPAGYPDLGDLYFPMDPVPLSGEVVRISLSENTPVFSVRVLSRTHHVSPGSIVADPMHAVTLLVIPAT